MAKLSDLKEQKQILEEQASIQQSLFEADRRRTTALKESLRLQQKISNVEKEIVKTKGQFLEADQLNLEKQILKIKNTGLGAAQKELGLENQLLQLQKIQLKGTKEEIKQANSFANLLGGVADGSKDLESVLRTIAEEDFGLLNTQAEELATILRGIPDLSKKLKVEADAQAKIDDFKDRISEASAFLSSPKAMGVAAIGLAVKLMTDFANAALEVRQSLGTSVVESARLAGNMKAAGLAAKAVGGSSSEAEAAVTSLVDEFGSMSVISVGVSAQLGLITGQFGLSGANAGKLLKSMQAINGASIETNLNLIGVVGSLARAEGVSPAQVLNDIAQDTETFANFAKDGGKNIAKAAIEARKLGLNLGTVAGIAESLLDFETSIESQMKASVLLGRQINTDKARELALSGDLKGLAIEIKNQVGSQAEFEEMNVVQRKALAEAMGVTVSDLGKIIAGKATEAELAEKSAEEEKKKLVTSERLNFISAAANVIAGTAGIIAAVRAQTEITITNEKGKQALLETKSLGKSIANAVTSLARGVGSIFSGMGVLGPIGLVLAGAGVASMYASSKKAKSSVPKAETGGIVKQSGLAEIHKGEAISGTKNELGFGADMTETNVLIKKHIAESVQLREQNQFLMNKLIRATGDLQLANA